MQREPEKSAQPECEVCHTALEVQGTRSFCPACLLRQVMGDDDEGEETAVVPLSPPIPVSSELPTVPRYSLTAKLGEGGFAIVYHAMQHEPVRREVAVKVLKPQVATAHVLARFEAERQTLARMEHPGIARLWDSGVTTDGQPFFAMELVRGEPITEYCAKHALPLRDRLELFCGICGAVQHAHEKGVLHRDLKPSNILVTDDGHERQVKIIDFGIAKALEVTPGTDDTGSMTALHQTVGTPGYMSPEQAVWGARSVDVRSDLYALGVVLYELITGRTPLQVERLTDERARYRPVARHITNVSKLAPEMLPTKLGRRDLDAITSMALAEEPALRYPSAAALADDVQHHLKNEPVKASEQSWTYVMEKFTRRHLPFVVSSSLTLLAILGGFTASTILYFKEQRARANAEAAQILVEERQSELITTLSRADFAAAQRFKQEGDYQSAVACLTRALRQDASFTAAAVDLQMLLSQENSPQPSETSIVIDPAWGEVINGAVAASGRELAVLFEASSGQRLMFFQVRDGEWQSREIKVSGPVEAMSMAASGDVLGYADASHAVHLLSMRSDGSERVWQSPDAVKSMTIAVKSGTAAVGCANGEVWLVNRDESLPPKKLGQISGAATHLIIGQDEPLIIAGGAGGEVRRFNARPPGKDELLMKLPAAVSAMTVANAMGVVAAGDVLGNVSCVSNIKSELLPVTQLHQGSVSALAFIGVPPTLISAGGHSDLRVRWTDLATRKDLEPPLESAGLVRSIWPVRSSDEALIITADSAVRVWRRDGEARAVTLRKPQSARFVAISQAANCIAVQRDQGRALDALMLSDRFMLNIQLQIGPKQRQGVNDVNAIAFSSDGRSLIVGDRTARAALWDAGSAEFLGDAWWTSPALALGRSSGEPMICALQDGSLIEIAGDGRKPEVRLAAKPNESWEIAAISPDGLAAIWGTLAGKNKPTSKVRVWWSADGSVRDFESERLSAVAVHGDTRRIAIGLGNGYVRVINPGNDYGVTVPLHQTRITSLCFSTDGHALITGSTDGTVAVWDAETLAPLTDFFRLNGQVLGVTFSGDGRRFACVTDGEMVAGDVVTHALIGRPFRLRRLDGHVAMNQDGTRLAASIAPGEVIVQDIAPPPATSVPGWFLNLADGYVSRHMTPQGTIERTSHPGQAALKQIIPADTANDSWTSLAHWLFAHTGLRTLTPWSEITVDQYIKALSKRPGTGKSAEIRRLKPFQYRAPEEAGKTER